MPARICCGSGFWNIQFNSLLNHKFTRRTQGVAFADDLILAIRCETASEVEKFSNKELSKIATWSKYSKIRFNEEKTKVLVISRRKRNELKEIKMCLQNETLEQVITLKYLGII